MTAEPCAIPAPADAVVIQQSFSDPDRFAVLFDRHVAELHRYVTRRLGATVADDIVAEAFLIAFRRRTGYNLTRADARPWLFGIATNLIGEHRRAEVRFYRALARTGADPVAESFTDRATARVAAESAQRELAAALAQLSAGDRDVLLLFGWAGLSYEETARALDVPVGTVRSRLHRARKKTRQALGGVNPAEAREENING